MNLFLSISGKVNVDTLSQMKQGDIIVVYSDNKLIWGIIDNYITENKLRIFETTYAPSIQSFDDKFIFTYDAIAKRSGDKDALIFLQEVFTNKTIQLFIDSLLAILLYKEDRIDSKLYAKLYSTMKCYHELIVFYVEIKNPILDKEPIINNEEKENLPKKNIIIKHRPETYVLYDYLEPKCQELWLKYYSNKEYKMRDVFNIIRKTYPQLFTSALKMFNTQNEDGNIYKLKSHS